MTRYSIPPNVTGPDVTERQWQNQIEHVAGLLGWLAYHTHDSRRSHKGFPDLAMVHPERPELGVVYLECKRQKNPSPYTPEQQAWIVALQRAGCTAAMVQPCDHEWVSAVLNGETTGPPRVERQEEEPDYYGCPDCNGDGMLDEWTFCGCDRGLELARNALRISTW
jgi:hypothetical protein